VGKETESPLSTLELQFWERISKDYRLEIACVNRSLELIQKINNYLYDEVHADISLEEPVVMVKKILHKPRHRSGKPASQWSKADLFRQFIKKPDQLRQMVWSLLCVEATERLTSARLLALTGHYSRVLSCVRDSNESLCWADFCLTNEQASELWLKGKKVEPPKSFRYKFPLSKHVGHPGDLDKFGTHSYIEAVETSILPIGPFTGDLEYSKSETIEKIHKEHTLACLGILLQSINTQLLYLTNLRPDLKNKFPETDNMVEAIDYIECRLIDEIKELNENYKRYL